MLPACYRGMSFPCTVHAHPVDWVYLTACFARTITHQCKWAGEPRRERRLMAENASARIVITVLGKNRPGIVAGISRVLGEENVDIRDITQSIIEDIFTMTMIADTSAATADFTALQERLAQAGEEIGVNVQIQREDVFNYMYRL